MAHDEKIASDETAAPLNEQEEYRNLAGSLPVALLRAREAVMAHFRPLLAERGFTEQQWRVLRVLEQYGPMDPTDIAEHSVILTSSLTRILKVLEEQSMISRAMHPTDRRRYVISITPEGSRIVRAAAPRSNQVYRDIEAACGTEKFDQLMKLLDELSQITPKR